MRPGEEFSYLLTRFVARDALSWPGIAQELARWRAACPTREFAEVFIAEKIHGMAIHRYQRCALTPAVQELAKLALGEVSFRHVAKMLLNRLTREPDLRQLVAARRCASFN